MELQRLSESSDPVETPETPVEQAPPFEYEPLDTSVDCIRLLAIDPFEEGDDNVKCSLTHVRFSEKPNYEALSYTWGLPTPTRRIWVNGKPINIRKNLYGALFCLRRSRKSRLLWADAICIDQSNAEERKLQVGLMDYIYTRAAKVLIWLGRAESTIEKAFAEMSEDVKEVDDDLKECLEWMCNQSYWKRLWVIQEIALSRNLRVYVGPYSQSWGRFLLHLTRYKDGNRKEYRSASPRRVPRILERDISPPRRRYYDRTSPVRETLISTKTANQINLIMDLGAKRLDRHGSENRLEQLLEDFQYAECEEPRDKIYGLLGLAHDCRSIPADYSRPLFDLYSDVLAHFCQTQKLADSRSNAFDRSMRITRFSQLIQSWIGSPTCPKMTNATKNIVAATGAVGGAIHRLGPTYEEVYSSSEIDREWRLAAESHYFTSSDREKLREANEAFDTFLFKNLDVVKEDVFGIDPQDLYSRATPDGGFWDGEEANWSKKRPKAGFCSPEQLALLKLRKHKSSKELFDFIIAMVSLEAKEKNVDGQFREDSEDNWCEEKLMGDFHPFEQPVLSHPPTTCSSPRLFLGSNLLLGLAPPEAKEGDVICHFWETDVVALLRKEIESGVYRIVGRVHLSTGYLRNLEPVYRDWIEPVKRADTIRIEMDVRALYKLTASST
jgi:hypothetical protein